MRAKRLVASLLTATMTLSLGATAFAAEVKPGSEGSASLADVKAPAIYSVGQDTVFFDVKGELTDIYDINKDAYSVGPDAKDQRISTFAGATAYYVAKDTNAYSNLYRWMNLKTEVYHLANDTTEIPAAQAIWAAQFKAPTGAVLDDAKPTVDEVNAAIQAAKGAATGEIILGDSLYVVEAANGKMGTAAKGSEMSITLDAASKDELTKTGMPVTLSTGIASLTLPIRTMVDSFKAKVVDTDATLGKLTDALVYDLSVNGEQSHYFDEMVEVKIPVARANDTDTLYVYYVDANDKLVSRLEEVSYKDGVLSFETDHFSKYAVSATLDSSIPTDGGGSNGGSSGGGGSTSSGRPSVHVSGTGGRITADDKGNVTITPDEGYQVKDVTVNGKSVGAVLSLKGLNGSDRVVVTFEKIPEEWNNPFTDVRAKDWFYEAVRFAYENKLFAGVSDTEFAPNQNMTRAMLVTVLYSMNGSTETGVSSFRDVPANAYYAKAVAWAEKNGIVSGVSATEFAPNQSITREQIAVILCRYAEFTGKPLAAGSLNFADAAKISSYAKDEVAAVQAAGIVSGRENGMFVPQGTATRAEIATMMMRYVEHMG